MASYHNHPHQRKSSPSASRGRKQRFLRATTARTARLQMELKKSRPTVPIRSICFEPRLCQRHDHRLEFRRQSALHLHPQHPIANTQHPASHCLLANRPCGSHLGPRSSEALATYLARTRREQAAIMRQHCWSSVMLPLVPSPYSLAPSAATLPLCRFLLVVIASEVRQTGVCRGGVH